VKELQWYNEFGEWEVHYRRPNNHPDVKDWEKLIAEKNYGSEASFGNYRIVEV